MLVQVRWFFNNEPVVSPDYQVAAMGDVHSLHIPEVFDEDAGRFSVTAENDSGKATCSALLVIVDEALVLPNEGSPPPTPLVGVKHELLPHQEAPMMMAPPMKQPPPPIVKPVPPPQPVIKPVPPPQPVAPPQPKPPVPVLAKFTQPLRNTAAEEGSRAVFETTVACSPDATVKWYKDGKEIINGPDFELQFKNNKASLTIAEVFAEDAGKYVCSVTNPAGTVETSAELIVKG